MKAKSTEELQSYEKPHVALTSNNLTKSNIYNLGLSNNIYTR